MSATLSKLTGTFMTRTGGNGFHDMDVRLEHYVRALAGRLSTSYNDADVGLGSVQRCRACSRNGQ